jgi:hypothetical protein
MRGAFEGAVARAELPRELNQHDLRHRRVTTWLAAGKSPVLVQKAMGHADLQTTMRYTHLVSEDPPYAGGGTRTEAPRAELSEAGSRARRAAAAAPARRIGGLASETRG